MGKKKRQGEPNANSEESTESSEDYRNTQDCPHINKSVDLTKLKKSISRNSIQVECEDCKKCSSPEIPTENGLYEIDLSLWMCLKCGNQACGRMKNKHALQHYNTPHSDCHGLCLNTSTWSVWCYECDEEVNITSKKKLLECVEYLKKYSEGVKKKKEPLCIPLCIQDKVIDVIDAKAPAILNQLSTALNLPRARGLCNLGNTCFFNSVMQCLGQTPHLLHLLEETKTPGQYFRLPGGKLCIDEKEKKYMELEPIDGILEKWKPLTEALAATLAELRTGRSEVYNPRMLLSRLTQRMPQFGGGDQHDSHELLRHLLEAVREEDLRRYQTIILEKLGLTTKTPPTTVEDVTKKIVKFYGSQASELLLPTEQVFRGVLVSTLQCQDCEHTSHRDEFFLDLSLPISEKQTPPILRRKADDNLDDNKFTKHQIKKEKRQQAKKNKKSKGNRPLSMDFFINNTSADTPMDEQNNDNNSESESDADVEDNVEDSSNNIHTPEDGPSKGTESGYNSDKNGSPDNITPDMCVDDSGVPSPAVGMLSVSPLGPGSPDNSPASSETNIDMGSPICGRTTPNDELNEEYERPESRLSFVHSKSNDLKVDLEKLSLKADNQNINFENRLEGAYGGIGDDDENEEKMEIEDNDMWEGTISARYHIEEGECSVQSCLNQFTTSELMTANNKVSCEVCTKRSRGADKKTVNTNARKQLLIYNPPAVLILHLKRFQVYHFRPAKVSKYVKFPTILDIAPFCSKRSKNLPTFEPGQTKVLYSLYGVVEHSGSMHGGHYVAYVKVRPDLPEDSYRWQFLPKNQKKDIKSVKTDQARDGEAPPGKWYYISDSHSSEVSESKVLGANAYLLFYERIL